jgi:ABC-type proline/glycine betaine transport system ATPase subunit
VLVTHHLTEGLSLGTQIAVMRAGRLVLERPRAEVDDAAFADEYRALVSAGGAG